MKLIISNKRLTSWLFIITAILAALSVFFQTLKYFLGQETVFGLVGFFSLDEEQNLPTFFSVFLLIVITILLFIIFKVLNREKVKGRFHWLGLSIIFLFLGFDEGNSMHEKLTELLRGWLDFTGVFYYGWVILGILLILIIFIFYIKFLISLSFKIRVWFFIAGLIYVSGALGIEMVGGWYFNLYGPNFLFQIITTFEEVLEMVGMIIFLKTLLNYLKLISNKSDNTLKIKIV